MAKQSGLPVGAEGGVALHDQNGNLLGAAVVNTGMGISGIMGATKEGLERGQANAPAALFGSAVLLSGTGGLLLRMPDGTTTADIENHALLLGQIVELTDPNNPGVKYPFATVTLGPKFPFVAMEEFTDANDIILARDAQTIVPAASWSVTETFSGDTQVDWSVFVSNDDFRANRTATVTVQARHNGTPIGQPVTVSDIPGGGGPSSSVTIVGIAEIALPGPAVSDTVDISLTTSAYSHSGFDLWVMGSENTTTLTLMQGT